MHCVGGHTFVSVLFGSPNYSDISLELFHYLYICDCLCINRADNDCLCINQPFSDHDDVFLFSIQLIVLKLYDGKCNTV